VVPVHLGVPGASDGKCRESQGRTVLDVWADPSKQNSLDPGEAAVYVDATLLRVKAAPGW